MRTTTLAAYHDGVEHYVTSFEFAGEGEEVGSIVPLPGVPTKVVKGGDWTLQRLLIETQPPAPKRQRPSIPRPPRHRCSSRPEIDSLDITVLEGGAVAVGTWARDHGFFLPPDAPEVLEFYAERSPIFLAARFNAERAAQQGVQRGEGTPIHVVIPTPRPWVPLRILALGRQGGEIVEADVFLLTDVPRRCCPRPQEPTGDVDQRGLILQTSERASDSLMRDLRSDSRMGWLPERNMWLTYVRVNQRADLLTHDLAIDASGYGRPDPVAAGLGRRVVAADPGPGRGSRWPGGRGGRRGAARAREPAGRVGRGGHREAARNDRRCRGGGARRRRGGAAGRRHRPRRGRRRSGGWRS